MKKKKLDALKYIGVIGLVGTLLYCASFMGLRLVDGSYLERGRFFATIAANLHPSFNQHPLHRGDLHLVFVLLSMIDQYRLRSSL